jgi:general secretion pathway protein C
MKKIFTLINLVVIFFIIDFSISAFYEYFARDVEIDDYFKSLDVQQQTVEKKHFQNVSYYTTIAARDLFKTGEIEKSERKQPVKPVAPPPKEIQETKLKLDLKGTITGTGSEPFAIIEERGKRNEKLYKEGDTVDRAVVKVILRQRVILLVDGKEETLLMEKNKIQQNFDKSADAAEEDTKDNVVNNVLLTWTDVDKLTEDLENLRKQVRVRPHFDKGKIDGFQVTGIKEDSVFYEQLGLRNGDVVAGVNGQEIKSIEDVMNLYNEFNQMEGNSVMDVDIKRNGSQEKIIYSIE